MNCIIEYLKYFNKDKKQLDDIIKLEIKKKKKFTEIELIVYNKETNKYKKIYLSIPKYILLKARGYIFLESYNSYIIKCDRNQYIMSLNFDKRYIKDTCKC